MVRELEWPDGVEPEWWTTWMRIMRGRNPQVADLLRDRMAELLEEQRQQSKRAFWTKPDNDAA